MNLIGQGTHLLDRPGGLVVEVTDGTTDYNASRYRLAVSNPSESRADAEHYASVSRQLPVGTRAAFLGSLGGHTFASSCRLTA